MMCVVAVCVVVLYCVLVCFVLFCVMCCLRLRVCVRESLRVRLYFGVCIIVDCLCWCCVSGALLCVALCWCVCVGV